MKTELPMTESDWEILASEHINRFSKEKEPVVIEENISNLKFLYVGKKTVKAKLYITEESTFGLFGFWCPKSAIIKEDKNSLTVHEWFSKTIKIIEVYL